MLVSLPDGTMSLMSPADCAENKNTRELTDKIISDSSNPISSLYYFDLKQSMQNGGGPACLRLRVPLNKKEQNALHQGLLFTPVLYQDLKTWANKYYREALSQKDLGDPELLKENRDSLDALSRILKLPRIYNFQG
jgi:succinylarginine dihydrolase